MRQDDRGVTLIEILVAITILVMCAIPLVRSMVLSSQMNLKSRRLLAATNTAEAVMEEMKADGMEGFLQKNGGSDEIDEINYIEENGEKVGYSFVYPEYEMDNQKFRVQVQVKNYRNEDAANDYNTKEIENLYRMNLATDAVYTPSLNQATDDFMKAVADHRLELEQKEEVLENLDIQYVYDIIIGEKTHSVEQSISYSYNGINLGKHDSQIFECNTDNSKLYSLYIFFEPKNETEIIVNNPKDYPLDLYLVRQGDKGSDPKIRLCGTELMQKLGEEQDPDFTKGIRLRTNFPAKQSFAYQRGGTLKTLTQGELENYFSLKPLDDTTRMYRLYDVAVEVQQDGKKITDLTGTIGR